MTFRKMALKMIPFENFSNENVKEVIIDVSTFTVGWLLQEINYVTIVA